MAATIQIDLADNSKEWIDALRARFQEGGDAAEVFAGHLNILNKELQSQQAHNAAAAIKQLSDEYANMTSAVSDLVDEERKLNDETSQLDAQFRTWSDEIADVTQRLQECETAMAEVDDASRSAGQSLDQAVGSSASENLSSMSSGTSDLIGAFQKLVEVGQQAYEIISKLAETNPKYAELKGAIDGVGDSMVTAAQRFAATDFGSGLIDAAVGRLNAMGEGLEALPTLWQDLRTIVHSTAAEIEESLGVEVSGHRQVLNAIRDENAALEAKVALAKQQAAQAMANKNAETALASIKKAEREAAQQAAIAKITDGKQAVDAINAELRAIEARRKAGTLTAEEASASVAKIAALRAQQNRIENERQQKEKAAFAADQAQAQARETDRVKQARKTAESLAAIEKKTLEDRAAAARKAMKEQWDAETKGAAERLRMTEQEEKAKAALLAKAAEQQKGNAAGILGRQNVRDIAKQVGEDRSQKAKWAFVNAHGDEYRKAKKSSNELAYQIKQATDPRTKKMFVASKRRHDKKLNELKTGFNKDARQARQQGFRDVVSGKASNEDITEAQQKLANNVINQGQSTGRLNKASAEALREATRVLLDQQAEQRAIARDLEQTKQILQQILAQGTSKGRRQAGR